MAIYNLFLPTQTKLKLTSVNHFFNQLYNPFDYILLALSCQKIWNEYWLDPSRFTLSIRKQFQSFFIDHLKAKAQSEYFNTENWLYEHPDFVKALSQVVIIPKRFNLADIGTRLAIPSENFGFSAGHMFRNINLDEELVVAIAELKKTCG